MGAPLSEVQSPDRSAHSAPTRNGHADSARGGQMAAPRSESVLLSAGQRNVTVVYVTELGVPFFLGTKPTRSCTRSGRRRPRPARVSETLSVAVFSALLRPRKTVPRVEPLPLVRR